MVIQPNPLVKRAGQGVPATLALGPGTSDFLEVVTLIAETSYVASWSILARADPTAADGGTVLRCTLPSGTTLWSTSPDVTWPFEVTAGGHQRDEVTYVQGPFAAAQCPRLDDFTGESMTRTNSGQSGGVAGKCDWLESRYVRDSAEWRQRRTIVPLGAGLVALVTSRATAWKPGTAFEAAGEIVRSLALDVEPG
jgi:hypothetical protein